jgi:Tfp pilus assembly protein PilF
MSRPSNSGRKERLFSSVIALASCATKKLPDPKSAEREKKNVSLGLGSGQAQAEKLQQGRVVF